MKKKFFIEEVGSCRGSNFDRANTITLKQLEEYYEKVKDDEWFEAEYKSAADSISYLFYDSSISTKAKRLKKLIKGLQEGKRYVESWEEGTTGIGPNKKELRLAVLEADRDGLADDVSKLVKEK